MPARVFRQIDEGVKIAMTRVDDGIPYYVNRRFDIPIADGWQAEVFIETNMDGGPGLRHEIRVCDSADPYDPRFGAAAATMTRAEELALELVVELRPWGAVESRQFVWQLDRITVGTASNVLGDALWILDEVAGDGDEVLPREYVDPYSYGLFGRTYIPDAVVGRRLTDFTRLRELHDAIAALGVAVAVVGDQVRLALREPPAPAAQ